MRHFRVFALVCFAFGLFVQVSAQAAAVPQAQTASRTDCQEMASSAHGDARERPADESGSSGMTLGCVIAMHCIPPIALADPAAADAQFAAAGTPYQPDGIVRLKGSPMRPESPPPQATLTA